MSRLKLAVYQLFKETSILNTAYIADNYEDAIRKQKASIKKAKNTSIKNYCTLMLCQLYYDNNNLSQAISTLKSLNLDELDSSYKLLYYNNLFFYGIYSRNKELIEEAFTEGYEIFQNSKNTQPDIYNIVHAHYYLYKNNLSQVKDFILKINKEKYPSIYNRLCALYFIGLKDYESASGFIKHMIKNDTFNTPFLVNNINSLIQVCINNGINIEYYKNISKSKTKTDCLLEQLCCIPILSCPAKLLLNSKKNFKNNLKEKWFLFYGAPFIGLFVVNKLIHIIFKSSIFKTLADTLSGDCLEFILMLNMFVIILAAVSKGFKKFKKLCIFGIILCLVLIPTSYKVITEIYTCVCDIPYAVNKNFDYSSEYIDVLKVNNNEMILKIANFDQYISLPIDMNVIDCYNNEEPVNVTFLPNSHTIIDVKTSI